MRFKVFFFCLLMLFGPAGLILAQSTPVMEAFLALHATDNFKKQLQAYIGHFDDTAAVDPDKHEVYLQQLVLTRYFALRAQNDQNLQADMLAFFQKGPWTTKEALLDIFSKMDSPRIKSTLLEASHAQTDEDKKLSLEQVALQSQPDQLIYPPQVASDQQLVQEWSAYLAKGNTRVVRATLDLLANTTTGYSTIVDGAGHAKQQILPVMAQLKNLALDITGYFLLNDSTIRSLILGDPEIKDLPVLTPVLKKLGMNAVAMGDPALLKACLAPLESHWNNAGEKTFYQGLEAGLKGDSGGLQAAIASLKHQASPYALGLIGWSRQQQFFSGRAQWKTKSLSTMPKGLVTAAIEAMAQATTWLSYQAMTTTAPPGRQGLTPGNSPLVVVARTPSGGVLCTLNAGESDCLMLHEQLITRWNSGQGAWSLISNFLINDQLRQRLSQNGLRTFIQDHRPVRITQVDRPGNHALIGLTYHLTSATAAVAGWPRLAGAHPERLILYLDQKTNLPAAMEVIYQLDRSKTQVFTNLTTFSAGDPFLLDWLQKQ